jgi:23S rRNA (cytidine1920-2'-O)/16S rRNA (cytidine1409-2'-O)-methyltransferase
MSKQRLDQALVSKKLVQSRSQAENYIKLGIVSVGGVIIKKPGYFVSDDARIALDTDERYVSRAALKLASVSEQFSLDFKNKVILDVGSSTGGFTDFALQHGTIKAIDVEVGSNQLHPSLRGDKRIELHEQTDIRSIEKLSSPADIVVIDVSFVSLREILPHVASLISKQALVVAMVKPQFEAPSEVKHKGVIKNERIRRNILKDFETWVRQYFATIDKADSKVSGNKGNVERFYLLKKI